MKKEWWMYLFLFFFFLVSMCFFATVIDGDVLWNYGFSYAIQKGEIPYKDFNMIITPLYPFLMSIPLWISNNILVFYISNAFLMTMTFYYLKKIVKEKTWFFLILMVFPLPILVQPNYNFLLVFLVILLLYCEKEEKSDYLIGLLIGLSILTKQSVGVFLLFPTIIYYWKEKKKVFKRLLACLGVGVLFLGYLFITNSFSHFWNLCFLGLFDFTHKNASHFHISLMVGFLFLFLSVVLYWKNRGDIKCLYILMFSSIMIPLFDLVHILYFFFVFSLLFVEKIPFSEKEIRKNSILFAMTFLFLFFMLNKNLYQINYPNHYHNFQYRLMINSHGEDDIRDRILQYMKQNDEKNIIIISSDAYFYQITREQKMNYFHLNNYGNHGYHGTEEMKKKIDTLPKNTIFIINREETELHKSSLQFNTEIAEYAMKKGKWIQDIDCYSLYEIK